MVHRKIGNFIKKLKHMGLVTKLKDFNVSVIAHIYDEL